MKIAIDKMEIRGIAIEIADRITVDVTNDLSAITINALGGEMIDENIQETIVEILSQKIRIAVIQTAEIQTAKILVEDDPEIEILGDFLAETEEEEIRHLLTTIGHAISVIMSTSHLEKNAIDVANPNRPNQTDRENSMGIKIRKRSGITEMMARIENSAKQEVNPPTMPTTGGLSLSMHALAREIAMIK